MKHSELMKLLKRHAKASGLPFDEVRGRGKGGHIEVHLGSRKTVIPHSKGEMPTGTVNAILKQLGVKK